MLGSTAPTTVIIGTVSQLILGNFYHWRTVVLFNMAFPIIAFIALCFVPESPHWLISKLVEVYARRELPRAHTELRNISSRCTFALSDRGRFEDAEKSLCWLRGWVTPDLVQGEFSMLKKFIRTKSKTNRMSLRETIRCYTQRTFIIPHLIVIGTFFVGHFGGMMSIQTNAVRPLSLLTSAYIHRYTNHARYSYIPGQVSKTNIINSLVIYYSLLFSIHLSTRSDWHHLADFLLTDMRYLEARFT